MTTNNYIAFWVAIINSTIWAAISEKPNAPWLSILWLTWAAIILVIGLYKDRNPPTS